MKHSKGPSVFEAGRAQMSPVCFLRNGKELTMATKLIYPAVFHPEEDGGYSVDFPDLLGCVTEGDTLSEAVDMAEDALGIYLYSLKEDKEPYPEPSNPADIEVEGRDFVSLVEYDEVAYLKRTDGMLNLSRLLKCNL